MQLALDPRAVFDSPISMMTDVQTIRRIWFSESFFEFEPMRGLETSNTAWHVTDQLFDSKRFFGSELAQSLILTLNWFTRSVVCGYTPFRWLKLVPGWLELPKGFCVGSKDSEPL